MKYKDVYLDFNNLPFLQMKKIVFSVLFLLSNISLYAQLPIEGKVIDRDTRKPIADVVVQYGYTAQDYTHTDVKGQFRIPYGSRETIIFQNIGYDTEAVSKDRLIQDGTVTMKMNSVFLNPVIISANDADRLLEKAMQNTKKRLLVEQSVGYLLHFLQTKTTDTLENELYMSYATTLTEKSLKKNLKKERVPYVFNVIDVNRLQRTVVPTSELYGAEYHASHLFTFGRSKDNETTRAYSADSSLLVLDIKPLPGKNGWAKGKVVINKEQMTILSMEIESVDSILMEQPYKKHMGKLIKIVSKKGKFSFSERNGEYYMTDCHTYYRFNAIDEYNNEEDVSYYCDVNFYGFVDKTQMRKRQLSGYCQELFYFTSSTERDFWNEENAGLPLLSMEVVDSEMLLRKVKVSAGKRFVNILKNSWYIVPIMGILYLAQ